MKALLIAPLVPSALWILLDGVSRAVDFGPSYFVGALLLGFYVVVVMEIAAFLVGLPLIGVLRNHLDSVVTCALAAAGVATVPVLALALLAASPDSASSDGIATVVEGHRTYFWYVELAETVGLSAAFGALGGVTFWWVRRGARRPQAK